MWGEPPEGAEVWIEEVEVEDLRSAAKLRRPPFPVGVGFWRRAVALDASTYLALAVTDVVILFGVGVRYRVAGLPLVEVWLALMGLYLAVGGLRLLRALSSSGDAIELTTEGFTVWRMPLVRWEDVASVEREARTAGDLVVHLVDGRRVVVPRRLVDPAAIPLFAEWVMAMARDRSADPRIGPG